MAIHESRAELGKQRDKRVVAGSPVQIFEIWASTSQPAVVAATVRDVISTDTSTAVRNSVAAFWNCLHGYPIPSYGSRMIRRLRAPAIHVDFGRPETAFVVQSGLSRRERITDEGCAAEEKKHDKA